MSSEGSLVLGDGRCLCLCLLQEIFPCSSLSANRKKSRESMSHHSLSVMSGDRCLESCASVRTRLYWRSDGTISLCPPGVVCIFSGWKVEVRSTCLPHESLGACRELRTGEINNQIVVALTCSSRNMQAHTQTQL